MERVDHVEVGEDAVVLDFFDLVLHVRDRVLGAKYIFVNRYIVAAESYIRRCFFRGYDEVG